MPTKTTEIRVSAKLALDAFKQLMTTNTKPLAVLLMEQHREAMSHDEA